MFEKEHLRGDTNQSKHLKAKKDLLEHTKKTGTLKASLHLRTQNLILK